MIKKIKEGTYKTKDEAKERLRQVEYFKHKEAGSSKMKKG